MLPSNTDNLAKFCFQQQLSLLNEEHMKILLLVCLSSELLDYDAIVYMFPELSLKIIKIVNELDSLSIIRVANIQGEVYYTILPIIKAYVLSKYANEEKIAEVKNKLNDYYQLKETDTYALLPIEERSIDKGSLIPRKLVDKAMKHSDAEEFELANQVFKKVIKDYENESYVWYMYGMYLAKYHNQLSEAINCLKKADELTPNYIYTKKIGDFHLRLKNYHAAVKNYTLAMEKSSVKQNQDEMMYCIAKTEYSKVKQIRRSLKAKWSLEKINERNIAYSNIVKNLEQYLIRQPSIYDGKLINIYRMFSESHFGLKNIPKSIEYIDQAIELSENEEGHVDYKKYILSKNHAT